MKETQWNRSSVTKAEDSKWNHCGFVFSEFFLEKQTQLLSYPNSMKWCLGENLSPPCVSPTCAHHRSQLHQCFTKTGQKTQNHLFSLQRPCGTLNQNLFCALDEQTALKGPEECKTQICDWEQRLFISRILCCRVAERSSSMRFFLDLQCAWQQQHSLALRWRTQGTLSACTAMSEDAHLCWEQATLPRRALLQLKWPSTNCSNWYHQDESVCSSSKNLPQTACASANHSVLHTKRKVGFS